VLIEVREERPDDLAAVRQVHRRAFEQEQESNIIDALRTNRAALFSLVATASDRVIGHIIYRPVTIARNVKGAALGPMAVLPEHQRQGIGIRLIEAGNRKIKDGGYPFIIVAATRSTILDSDSDQRGSMESSANGMFPMMSSWC